MRTNKQHYLNHPKKKWTYVKDLENKKIEVGQYEVKDKGPYQMQCGSFRTKKQAEVLKANIAFSGISSQIRTVQGKNGTWHKVVVGPYERKRPCRKRQKQIKTKQYKSLSNLAMALG